MARVDISWRGSSSDNQAILVRELLRRHDGVAMSGATPVTAGDLLAKLRRCDTALVDDHIQQRELQEVIAHLDSAPRETIVVPGSIEAYVPDEKLHAFKRDLEDEEPLRGDFYLATDDD